MAMARAHLLTLVPTCGRCRALRMSAMRLRYVARSIGPLQSVTPTESPVATRTVFLIAQTGKPNRHHAGLRGHPPHAAQAFGGVLRREGEPDVERGDETALRVPLLAALTGSVSMWLRGLDLNQRPLGYEGVSCCPQRTTPDRRSRHFRAAFSSRWSAVGRSTRKMHGKFVRSARTLHGKAVRSQRARPLGERGEPENEARATAREQRPHRRGRQWGDDAGVAHDTVCVRESEPSHLGHLARQERRRGGCRAADRVAGRGLARPGALVVLDPQLRHEVRVAGALDDRVELRAVVGDEADALERDVIGAPAAPLREHAVVQRDRRALLRHDQGPDHRGIAVERLPDVLDLFAVVILDLRNVRVLEQVPKQARELLALRRGACLPVQREATPGDLREIEDLVGARPGRAAPLERLRLFLERRVGQDAQDPVDRAAQLVGWWAGQSVAYHEQAQHRSEHRQTDPLQLRQAHHLASAQRRVGRVHDVDQPTMGPRRNGGEHEAMLAAMRPWLHETLISSDEGPTGVGSSLRYKAPPMTTKTQTATGSDRLGLQRLATVACFGALVLGLTACGTLSGAARVDSALYVGPPRTIEAALQVRPTSHRRPSPLPSARRGWSPPR